MTVYVDRANGNACCYLTATTPAELDAFAATLGLRPAWKQAASQANEHYDLTPALRERAVALGAVEAGNTRDMLRRLLAERRQPR